MGSTPGPLKCLLLREPVDEWIHGGKVGEYTLQIFVEFLLCDRHCSGPEGTPGSRTDSASPPEGQAGASGMRGYAHK